MKTPILNTMEINGDEGVFNLDVQPQLEAFHGHFPDYPILPGVVQLDWVMHFATTYLGSPQRVAQEFKVKFHRIIKPNIPLTLNLRLDRGHSRLFFTYRSEEHIMSKGQITLKVQP